MSTLPTLSGLPLISRGEIHDEEAFRHFGCDVVHANPPTPDTVVPHRHIEMEFDSGKIAMPNGEEVDFWGLHPSGQDFTFPGPAIRVREGEIVHATFHSKKNVHTIHWHGIDPTTFNDGVGHTSFELTSDYTYQWYARFTGTYIYHCHVNTVLHFEMGMYGPLLIDPPQGEGFVFRANEVIPYDVEAAWAVDEIDPRWRSLGHHAGISCPFGEDAGLNDFRPEFFCITGAFSDGINPILDPRAAVNAHVGQTILLRLVHAGYTVQEYVFDGLDVEVIEADGRTLGRSPDAQYSHPFTIPAGTPFRLTSARRFALLLRPTTPGVFPCQVRFINWVTQQVYHTASTLITVM